jgi:hypothetical protein
VVRPERDIKSTLGRSPVTVLPLTNLKGKERYHFRPLLVGLYIPSTLYCGLIITSNEVIAAWENASP